jgi:hypothetical protein
MCLILSSYKDRDVLISRHNFVRFLFAGLDEGRSLQKKVEHARPARVLDASAPKNKRQDQLRRKTSDPRTRVAK